MSGITQQLLIVINLILNVIVNIRQDYNEQSRNTQMVMSSVTLCIAFCAAIGLSQYAQLGGAPIINILMMFVVALPTPYLLIGSLKSTTPILWIILLAGSLISFIRSFKKINEITKKYVIDYELILIILPMAASGAIFGDLTKNMLSQLLISIIQAILLIYLVYKCNKDMNSSYQPINPSENNINTDLTQKLITKQYEMKQTETKPKQNVSQFKFHQSLVRAQQQINPELQKIINQEQNRIPKTKLKIIGFIILYTFVILLIKKAATKQLIIINPPLDIPQDFTIENTTLPYYRKIQSFINYQFQTYQQTNDMPQDTDEYVDVDGINGCVFVSLLCLVAHLTLSYLSSKSVAIQIYEKDSEKQKYGFVFLKQTDKMSSKKMWSCLISGFLAGIIISLFGVGCSIILLPAFIGMEVQEETALSTSTAITFLTSFIVVCMEWFTGTYGSSGYLVVIIVMIFTIIIVLITQCLMNRIRHGNKLNSYIRNRILFWIFLLSLILFIIYQLAMYAFNYKIFTQYGYFC